MKKLLLIAIAFPLLAACGNQIERLNSAVGQVNRDCAKADAVSRPDCVRASLDHRYRGWDLRDGAHLTTMLQVEDGIASKVRDGKMTQTAGLDAEHGAERRAIDDMYEMIAGETAGAVQAADNRAELRRERNASMALMYLQMQSQRPVYVQPAPQPYVAPPISHSTQCQSSVYGNQVYTSCN